MHGMMELRNKLEMELDELTKQGKMTTGILDSVDKITHTIKSIDTIKAMEEGYSNRGSYGGSYGGYYDNSYDGSYARDRRGRNADGSYRIRRDGGRDQRYSYERGYSRGMKEQLEDMMENARPEEKKMIRMWMQELDG